MSLTRALAVSLLRLTRRTDRVAASLLRRVGPEATALVAYRDLLQRMRAQIFPQPFTVAEQAYADGVALLAPRPIDLETFLRDRMCVSLRPMWSAA